MNYKFLLLLMLSLPHNALSSSPASSDLNPIIDSDLQRAHNDELIHKKLEYEKIFFTRDMDEEEIADYYRLLQEGAASKPNPEDALSDQFNLLREGIKVRKELIAEIGERAGD